MSYYNDSFTFALEQQSYELDNMLAELDSYGSMEASGALESVQNTVAGIYDVDACGDLLDKLAGVTESYNSALEQMRDAAEMYQYTEDRQSTMEAMYPAQESLKAIYSNIVGYAPEGNVSTDIVETIHDFILGSREIIEGKMMELGGMRRGIESYSGFYPTSNLDMAIEQARFEYEDAMADVYACMKAGYAEYGYAFEAEASGAEKAKKEGLFQRAKKAFINWCTRMATICSNKRAAAKNKAVKGIWNTFYGVFKTLAGEGKALRDERALEKANKKAQKNRDNLSKQLEAQGENPNQVPNAPRADDLAAAFGVKRSDVQGDSSADDAQAEYNHAQNVYNQQQRDRQNREAYNNRTPRHIYNDIRATAKKVAELKSTGGPAYADAKRELDELRKELRNRANTNNSSEYEKRWGHKVTDAALGLEAYLSILNAAEAICEAALGEDYGYYENPVNSFFSMF